MSKRIFLLLFCLSITIFSCRINYIEVEKEGKAGYYMQDTAKELKVPLNKVYYISTESGEKEEYTDPSIITFIKNEKYVNIDNIEKEDEEGNVYACGLNEINKETINANLKPTKAFSSMVYKRMLDEKRFEFPKDKIVGIMIYTNLMKSNLKNYVNLLKSLEEQGDIEYLIVSIDGNQIIDLPDMHKEDIQVR